VRGGSGFEFEGVERGRSEDFSVEVEEEDTEDDDVDGVGVGVGVGERVEGFGFTLEIVFFCSLSCSSLLTLDERVIVEEESVLPLKTRSSS
jgi:hypothetical protein